MSDYICTIDSNDEVAPESAAVPASKIKDKGKGKDVKSKGKGKEKGKGKGKRGADKDEEDAEDGGAMDAAFAFDGLGGGYFGAPGRHRDAWDVGDPTAAFRKKNAPPRVNIDEIIARHRGDKSELGGVAADNDWGGFTDSGEDSDEEEEQGDSDKDPKEVSSDEEADLGNDGLMAAMDGALVDDGQDTSADDGGRAEMEGGDSASDVGLETDNEMTEEEARSEADLAGKTGAKDDEEADIAAAKAYFDQTTMPFDPATAEELAKDSHDQPFSSLPGSAKLSRSVLLGLASLSLTTPTPIQRQTIPLALLGKDLVCSSVTGSGKTVGYLVPILERLTWRDKRGGGRTRVMILTPTRELAVQVHQVAKALARYNDLTFCLCVGGMNLRTQEAELRERPDVIIGTPGRVIDHVRNTRGFSLDTLEILVIDEADRILEEGFRDELEEIIGNCPRSRQTMLFSATVTESVADLARLSLDKPVRIKIDPARSTALGLTQEFLRIREKKGASGEDRVRQAVLVAVCRKAFNKGRTIIFFRSKKGAHRMRVLFGLCGLQAEELHGDLTQEQRLTALQKFKEGGAGYLLATDLASRGLDIKGVESVINFETPNQYEVYLHRIGRTARAGKTGRALTLVGESDRKLVKEARKNAPPSMIKQRHIPPALVSEVVQELEALEPEVDAVLQEETEEKAIRVAEMQIKKGQNLIQFEEEIKGRPARTWFQSEKDKKQAKQVGTDAHNASFSKSEKPPIKRDRFAGLSRAQKRRKMAAEDDARDSAAAKATSASIRHAKKAQRPGKIGTKDDLGVDPRKVKKDARAKQKEKQKKKKSGFEVDLGAKGRSRGSSSAKAKAKVKGPKGSKGKIGRGKTKGKR